MNKNFLLSLLFISFALSIQGQNTDSIRITANYIATFKNYTDQTDLITEEKNLEIADHHTAFYGRWQRRREEIVDSITKIHGSIEEMTRLISKYPTPRSFYSVYTNYPVQSRRTVIDEILKSFYYEEAITPIFWTILPRDTTILSIPCHFATCTYGNRKWTACFAASIPVQAGPWKLQGLPGLILFAHDDSGIFSFECIEIKNGQGLFRIPSLAKCIKSTRKELQLMKKESAADPLEFERRRFGLPGKAYDNYGKPLIYKKRIPVFLEN